MTIESDMALLAAGSYWDLRGTEQTPIDTSNRAPLPAGWTVVPGYFISRSGSNSSLSGDGFSARVYQGPGGQIVMSFAGTEADATPSGTIADFLNGNVPLAIGRYAEQAYQAALLYQRVKADSTLSDTISFTGHSLGGGLAGLMAVWFNRPAYVFAPAPFQASADYTQYIVELTSKSALFETIRRLRDIGRVDPELERYNPSSDFSAREQNVQAWAVKGEVLEANLGTLNWIEGSSKSLYDNPANSLSSVNKHFIDLHAAALVTPNFETQANKVPTALERLFDSALYGYKVTGNQQNVLVKLLRNEVGVRNDAGMVLLAPNAMLSHFAADLQKLGANITGLNKQAQDALIAQGIEWYYWQGSDYAGAEFFTQSSGLLQYTSAKGAYLSGAQNKAASYVDAWMTQLASLHGARFAASYAEMQQWNVVTSGTGANASAAGIGKSQMFIGGAGNDSFTGSQVEDVMFAGAGNDSLSAGAGKDELYGGAGNDTMDGGLGYDSYVIEDHDRVRDADGLGRITDRNGKVIGGAIVQRADGSYAFANDASITVSKTANLLLFLADGSSVTIENFNDGDLGITTRDAQAAHTDETITLTLAGDLAPVDFNPVAEGIQVQYDGLGNVIVSENAEPDRVDALYGDASANRLDGLGGNDSLWGLGGDDRLYGGTGADALMGGAGWDLLEAGLGDDTLFGEGDDDKLFGRGGGDALYGGVGYDVMAGGEGRDIMFGGGDNDELYVGDPVDIFGGIGAADTQAGSALAGELMDGGAGQDILIGDAGADLLSGGSGADVIAGGGGDDNLMGDWASLGATLDWSATRVLTPEGNVIAHGLAITNASYTVSVNPGNDEIHGGMGDDWVFAGAGDDYVDGGGDNDVLFGNEGYDVLFGGAGNDGISGDSYGSPDADQKDDYLDGEDGNDTLWGGGGADEMFGGAGNDRMLGDYDNNAVSVQGDDYLDGEDGDDDMYGAGGNDVMFGGIGADQMTGDSATLSGSDYLDGEDGDDTLWGGGGDDMLVGGAGADQLNGDGNFVPTAEHGADMLSGGLGNDSLWGQGGDDTLWGDEGNDSLSGNEGADLLDGGTGADLIYGGAGDDQIDGADGDDSLVGEGGADYLVGDAGADQLHGEALDTALADHGADTLSGGAGNDALVGYGGNDMLLGGEDNDSLMGGDGDDDLAGGTGSDELQGGAGVDGLSGGADNDLLDGEAGNDFLWGDEGADQLGGGTGNDSLLGGAGADMVWGDAGDDTLSGGADNDSLLGGSGNDTYVLELGDGADSIFELFGDVDADVLRIGAGIAPADISFWHGNDGSLIARHANGVDQVAIQNWYVGGAYQIDSIVFADGTQMTAAQMEEAAGANPWRGGLANDTMAGGSSAEIIDGDAGDDLLDGGAGNDTLLGGAGIDTLQGGLGDDLAEGGAGNDILLGQDGNDSLLGDEGNDQLVGGIGNDTLLGGVGDDTAWGDAGDDVLAGGADSDTLVGGLGNDSYRFGRGDDFDVIYDADTTADNLDWIEFAADISPDEVTPYQGFLNYDLNLEVAGTMELLTIANYFYSAEHQVEEIRFADGTVWTAATLPNLIRGSQDDDILLGTTGADIFKSDFGNDYMLGDLGDDRYHYELGIGFDSISDEDATPGNLDKVLLPVNVLPADVTVARAGDDLFLSYAGGGFAGLNGLTLKNYFLNDGVSSFAIEQIKFLADGTVWELDDIKPMVLIATEGNNVRIGYASADMLYGLAGNDTLLGKGGDDTLNGGLGNDSLVGGAGNDLYVFARGEGLDSVSDGGTAAGEIDTLQFAADILPADVQLRRTGATNLEIRIASENNVINLPLQFSLDGLGADSIERIQFLADGTVWDLAAIKAMVSAATAGGDLLFGFDSTHDVIDGLGGNDVLHGLAGNDSLSGGLGNDSLYGEAGSDTYLFARGDGADLIVNASGDGAGSTDRLLFAGDILPGDVTPTRAGDDLVLTVSAGSAEVRIQNYFVGGLNVVEEIRFANGTAWNEQQILTFLPSGIVGTAGNDTIYGFATDDVIDARGGNDLVYGDSGNDTITGGTGDDALFGQAGDDTYILGLNSGSDWIYEQLGGLATDFDQLVFVDGINYSDVVIENLGQYHLRLRSSVSGFSATFAYQLYWESAINGVEQIVFADGVVLDRAGIERELFHPSNGEDWLAGTSAGETIDGMAGNDFIYGRRGDDELHGGAGNDRIFGGAGNDVFDYRLGDGHDLISDDDSISAGGTDTLRLGAGISPSLVVVSRELNGETPWDLLLSINASDKVLIGGYYIRGDIELVQFSDGTVWTKELIAHMLPFNGTDGADTVSGTNLGDVVNGLGNASGTSDSLFGRGGNDTINGGAGADQIYGGVGNDILEGGTDSARKIAYRDALYGEWDDDRLVAGSAPADMYGGLGNDLDIGAAGADTILEDASDNSRNFMFGAAGADSIRMHSGGAGLAIGGLGADAINGGLATDGVNSKLVIAFNKSDGIDSVGLLAPGSTISIGGGTLYSNLSFEVVGLNLRIKTGSSHYVELVGWHGTGAGQGRNVSTLQIVTEGTRDYSATSADPMKNRKVQTFNFLALVAAYDAAGRPSNFSIANNLAAVRIGGSDTDAIGGAIAYQYARTGNLGTLSYAQMQAVVNDAVFGSGAQPITAPAALAADAAAEASADVSAAADSTVASTDTSNALLRASSEPISDDAAEVAIAALAPLPALSVAPAAPMPAPSKPLVHAPMATAQAILPAPPSALAAAPAAPTQMDAPITANASNQANEPAASSSAVNSSMGGNAPMPSGQAHAGGPGPASAAGQAHAAIASPAPEAAGPPAEIANSNPGATLAQPDGAAGKQGPVDVKQDPHDALIDQWFNRNPQNDDLTLYDEILRGDSGGNAQIQLSPSEIAASWQRSHAYLNKMPGRAGAGEGYADGADIAGWANMGLDAGRFAMAGGIGGGVGNGAVGLRGVAGHDMKSFKGLQEGMNALGGL